MVVIEAMMCILHCVMTQDRASTGGLPQPGTGVSTLPRNLSILSLSFVDFRALMANSASRFDQQSGGTCRLGCPANLVAVEKKIP